MNPREQWPQLWHFFDVLHQDWELDFADKDDCLRAWTGQAETVELEKALGQWHEAFDAASDLEVRQTVEAFNPWWYADRLFGGARQWAEWVREHLERELKTRMAI